MSQNNCLLRAVVSPHEGGVEAQLLEIDIAARANDIESLLKELGHAIVASYEIALDLGNRHLGVLNAQAATLNLALPLKERRESSGRKRKRRRHGRRTAGVHEASSRPLRSCPPLFAHPDGSPRSV